MKLVDLLIEMRTDILGAIGSVEDSSGGLVWDNTRPNWSTRSHLQDLFKRYLSSGAHFGVFSVVRHCDCPDARHSGDPISPGSHGIKEWRDKNFIWSETQIFQGERLMPCACGASTKPIKHWVIEELVIRKHGATKRHECFVQALSYVQEAIDNAGEKKPRSAIREWLLYAVLQLNDSILPHTVDEFIKQRHAANQGRIGL